LMLSGALSAKGLVLKKYWTILHKRLTFFISAVIVAPSFTWIQKLESLCPELLISKAGFTEFGGGKDER